MQSPLLLLCSHFVVLLKETKHTVRKTHSTETVDVIFFVNTYPVLKIKFPASSATSEPASEPRWGPSGRPEGTSAHGSSPTSSRTHEASAPEAPSAPVVSEGEAEGLGVHSPLFSPGWPPVPETQIPQC